MFREPLSGSGKSQEKALEKESRKESMEDLRDEANSFS
jgi:hypothetical protein